MKGRDSSNIKVDQFVVTQRDPNSAWNHTDKLDEASADLGIHYGLWLDGKMGSEDGRIQEDEVTPLAELVGRVSNSNDKDLVTTEIRASFTRAGICESDERSVWYLAEHISLMAR